MLPMNNRANNKNTPNPLKGGVPADIYNKNKLADEAKRETERAKAGQRQQERTHIQLQIDNLKRSLQQLEHDLNNRQILLAAKKREADEVKRASFLINSQVMQKEGDVAYLTTEEQESHRKTIDSTKDINKAEFVVQVAETNKAKLESDYQNSQASVSDLERELAKLQAEVIRVSAELKLKQTDSDNLKKAINVKAREIEKMKQSWKGLNLNTSNTASIKMRVTKTIEDKKKDIKKQTELLEADKRRTERLTQEIAVATQDISRLNRDLSGKQQELKTLEIKRDAIPV